MKTIPLVTCMVKSGNRILLMKRAKHEQRPGVWEFPLGRIEKGETSIEAAKREIKEETSLSLEPKFIGMVERFDGENNEEYKPVSCFVATTDSEEIKLSDEHDEFKWVTMDGLKGPNISYDAQMMLKTYFKK